MQSLLDIIDIVAQVVFFLVLIQLVLGLLIQFDIANPRHPLVNNIYNGISRLLDPILNPIRRILPPTGGLDFSPMVLLVLLTIIRAVVQNQMV